MNTLDPKLVALQFNECINRHDPDALAAMMREDHTFIDREGKHVRSRDEMLRAWREFFRMYPKYRNTFTRIQSSNDRVAILGSAYWSEDNPFDPVIWTAVIANDLVREWRVLKDTETNRQKLGLS
jgi:uncharacterized protein (TIGR02246 family)